MREWLTRMEMGILLDKGQYTDVIGWLQADEAGRQELYQAALRVKQRHYGTTVYMRGLIEFSSYCRRNCVYCGIRSSNQDAVRYRLSSEQILESCEKGYRLGYRTFVLQSGEDLWYTTAKLISIIQQLKREYPDAAVTLSIGERSEEEYRRLREAGADRFLLRHETASKSLYEQLHPGMSYEERHRCLRALKQLGYQVGAGFMVGLPGQKQEDLAEELLLLYDMKPDMIGIGPFIPHPRTPLHGEAGGTVDDTLIMVALVRLLLPYSLIPATTAMGSLDPMGREKALKAGANVVMPNLTPVQYKPAYQLYTNKICLGDEAEHCRGCIEMRIAAAGFEVDMGRGDVYSEAQ